MKNQMSLFQGSLAIVALALGHGPSLLRAESKPKPEELIRSHLERLASPDALRERTTMVARGVCELKIITGGGALISGQTLLLSENRNLSIELHFGLAEYTGEHYVLKDGDVSVAYTTPGRRSPLGEFLLAQNLILKEGLLGGVYSTAWPLIDFPERKARVKVKGLKKVDDRRLQVLEYQIPRSGNLRTELFFDPETNDHVRTEYSLRISAGQSLTPEAAGRTRSIRYRMEERFSDFKDFDGYRLPTRWVVQFSRDGDGPTLLWQWTSELREFSQNQPISPDRFELK